jgi:hypothetical protein
MEIKHICTCDSDVCEVSFPPKYDFETYIALLFKTSVMCFFVSTYILRGSVVG